MTLRVQHAIGIVLNQCQFCKQTSDASCSAVALNYIDVLSYKHRRLQASSNTAAACRHEILHLQTIASKHSHVLTVCIPFWSLVGSLLATDCTDVQRPPSLQGSESIDTRVRQLCELRAYANMLCYSTIDCGPCSVAVISGTVFSFPGKHHQTLPVTQLIGVMITCEQSFILFDMPP